jgi:RND superfamily putative drug exporter
LADISLEWMDMLFRLGLLMVRFRWLVIAAWLVAFLVAGAFAPRVLTELTAGFGNPDTEGQRGLELLAEKLGEDEAFITVVFSHDTLRAADPDYRRAVEHTLAGLADDPHVAQIATLYNGGNPNMVSDNGHTSYALVSLNVTLDEGIDLYSGLRDSLSPPEGFRLWATGAVAIFSTLNTAVEDDLRRSEAISLPLVLVALALVFGTLVATAMPLAMAAMTVVITMALVYAITQVTDVSIFVLNIAIFLGIGIAIDYTLLLVSRFREELLQRDKAEAVGATMATAGRAVIFSGLTTMVGLSGFFFIPIMFFRSFGFGGVTVVLLSVLVVTTLVPAMLGVLGTRINSLRVLPVARSSRGVWHRLALAVMRYPLLVAVPVILLLALLGAPFLGVKIGAPWASVLPRGAEARLGWETVEQELGPGVLSPVTIVLQVQGDVLEPAIIGALYDFTRDMEADPRVERVSSIVSIDPSIAREQYQQMYVLPLETLPLEVSAAVQALVFADVTMINVFTNLEAASDEAEAFVDEIRAREIGPDITALVTGVTAAQKDITDLMYRYFPLVILYVVLATYLVLMVLFRSVVLPLKAVIMNVMSIFASYGALVFIFQQGNFDRLLAFRSVGYTEATIPIIVFCIVFGLSMDYEVFLLSRIKEAYDETGDNTGSVAVGLEKTGRIITSAAIILVLVAAAFATSDVIVVKAFGVATAIAILLDATAVRALLVPALMRILGDWNWWAPRFLQRLLPQHRMTG